jgi:hypothetical protein
MKFGVDYAHNTGNQHYRRLKWNSGIKSFVVEEMPCKTQVINDVQGQAPPQQTSQRFVTLLKAIVGLLWLKFVWSLVWAMGACSPSSKPSCSFKKFWPSGYPGCWVMNKNAVTEEKLAQLYWSALQHPPYSPDLSPCDYHMFGPLKEALGEGSVSTMMNRSRISYAIGYRCVLLHSMTQD